MKSKIKFAAAALMVAAFFLTPQVSFAAKDVKDEAKLLAEKKAELNGHEWDVKLVPAADPKKGTPVEDTLVFKDMKFESKGNASKGFVSTNYTITLQEGGPSVWETMQSNDKGETVNWRGEWEGDAMHGVMSKQSGGKNEDFYFNSVGSKAIPAETPKPEEAAPASAEAAQGSVPADAGQAVAEAPAVKENVQAQETPQPPSESKDKKKKKWF